MADNLVTSFSSVLFKRVFQNFVCDLIGFWGFILYFYRRSLYISFIYPFIILYPLIFNNIFNCKLCERSLLQSLCVLFLKAAGAKMLYKEILGLFTKIEWLRGVLNKNVCNYNTLQLSCASKNQIQVNKFDQNSIRQKSLYFT